jgi:hypothetical protein
VLSPVSPVVADEPCAGVRDGRALPHTTVGLALLAHHAELQVVMTLASLACKTASVSLSAIVARFAIGGA